MNIGPNNKMSRQNCFICSQMENALFKLFSDLPLALSEDKKAKHEFAREFGFCSFHTWQLAAFSSQRGIAKSFPPLIKEIETYLSNSVQENIFSHENITLFIEKNRKYCRVCRLLQKEEDASIALLIEHLKTPEGKEAYAEAEGLCLRHLASLIARNSSHDLAHMLIKHAVKNLQQIASDLAEYEKKYDARLRHTCTNNEKRASSRALNFIAGLKNIYFVS